MVLVRTQTSTQSVVSLFFTSLGDIRICFLHGWFLSLCLQAWFHCNFSHICCWHLDHRNNPNCITQLTQDMSRRFFMKDLGSLHYFLDMEVYGSTNGMHLSQSKYILDLLTRTNMLDCKPVSTPIAGKWLSLYEGEPFSDVHRVSKCGRGAAIPYIYSAKPWTKFVHSRINLLLLTGLLSRDYYVT